ncbi:hypothetical protein NHX12_031469 [Muraenolepis orangiensis]|uniref:WH2 domain-containing protein n=1 Tax=Muraenolepis orangiensis TaxID=630683 RepID=A0A9Q0E5Y4_9TELE|nr:hypothetical protein NHX12_031469 [Muraenolepis orangiensis]
MPIPPPPPPGGPPPPPTFSQANTTPPKLNREEAKGRGALLTDLCNGTRLRKVAVVDDCSGPQLEIPKRGSSGFGGASNSGAGSPSGSVPPIGGLFQAGVPRLRPVGDGSSGRSPTTRGAAPRPPSFRHDDAESPSPQALSPTEPAWAQRPEKPLPPTPNNNTPPLPAKPPPSPGNSRRPPTSGGNSGGSSSSLAPPLPHYRVANGPTGAAGLESAPDLPQRHNSLGNKRQAPSPGGHTPTREPPGRATAPSVPGQARAISREAPPPPPYRTHGSPSLSSDPPTRGKPPPPPTRTPAGPPPPPPPIRNGHSSSSVPRSFVDDFESKSTPARPTEVHTHTHTHTHTFINDAIVSYMFICLFLFVVPVMRGAPPLPPVGR